jgi:hypothetical protein
MSLLLRLYGQNDGQQQPDVNLTGDPGTDQLTLTNAGYLGGKIMALKTSATAGRGVVAVPCDAATEIPYGALLNGPGEFAGSIGPSGSHKVPIVRALFQGLVDSQAFVATPTAAYTIGGYLYCGTGASAGLYTSDKPATGSTGISPVGICTALPTGTYPLLGVASLL